ncbi:hypothetical protein CMZ82_09825 [Lysobacteraceae bacterium NML93-0792]|nr:hypothetical protein CMZ82_09825 [Xanthomonadaceae bacterium NML93-0792]PBS15989.1 hypothetical protein CMZ81_08645 [Xanthomonadaceae bacterium NML93-0793]PBS18831.1 hypothetical protein CMZ80_08950 [Xanthomonadaceae bacterium NML93-0831]
MCLHGAWRAIAAGRTASVHAWARTHTRAARDAHGGRARACVEVVDSGGDAIGEQKKDPRRMPEVFEAGEAGTGLAARVAGLSAAG